MEGGYTPAVDYESQTDDDNDYADIKKKLFDADVLETPVKREGSKKQPVVVYLRVRPKSHFEILNEDHDCLHQVGESEIVAVAPRASQTYKNKNGWRSEAEGNQKFTFSRIFDPPTTQKELFDDGMMSTLKDFLHGQNCLIFTYGVTNSGKTYTVTGTPTNPGILPRSLDVIFNSIDRKKFSNVTIKPKHFSDVTYLSKEETEAEELAKQAILSKAHELSVQAVAPTAPTASDAGGGDEMELSGESDVSVMSKASSNCSKITEDGLSMVEFQVHDDSSIELENGENLQFSIWVSFAEIYNEFIYDLLAEAPKKRQHRPALKLAEDKNHNHFIKGLKEVQVENIEEAMWLLRLGLQQRHVAATRLNYQSSRSHSIYTIKIIKVVDTKRPHMAFVNRISIVDLAGAERSGKTGATGTRMKEAGNINNSLLTLGKCIDAMKYNQTRKGSEDRVVPFRESKLTRLFQNYFIGKGQGVRQGKITMFVNVSNNASVFDETIHVLKFSALASKVIPVTKDLPVHTPALLPFPTPALPPLTPSVQPKVVSTTPYVQWEREVAMEEPPTPVNEGTSAVTGYCPRCKVLEARLCQCKEEAKKEVSQMQVKLLEVEYMLRQEVCAEFNDQLIEIEDKHSRELEEQAEDLQEMYEKRMVLLQKSMKKQYSRKRRRPNDDTGEDMTEEHKLRVEVANLQERVREAEEELALERNKTVAEFQDASESYETKVVLLNQQLADAAIKLSAAQKAKAEVRAACDSLRGQLELEIARRSDKESEKSEILVEREAVEELLRSECQSLKDQLDLATQRISQLASENSTLESDQSAALTRHEELLASLEVQKSSELQLRSELEVQKSSESQLRSELEVQKSSELQLRSELELLRKELETTSAEVVCLQSQEAALVAQRKKMESQLQSECKSLRDQLDLTTQRVAELASHNTSLEIVKAELLDKYDCTVQVLEGDVTEANSTHVLLETRCQELTDQLKTANEQIAALISQNKLLEEERVSFADTHGELLAVQRADAAAEVEILQARISELTSEKCSDRMEMEARISELTSEKCSDRMEMEAKIVELRQASSDQCDMKESELHSTVESLTSQLKEMESELASLQQTHTDKIHKLTEDHDAQLTQLRSEVDSVHSQLSEKQSELTTIKQGHAESLHSLHGSQEEQLASLKSELDTTLAKVVMKQESLYRLEAENEARGKEVISLQSLLEKRDGDVSSLREQNTQLEERNGILNGDLVDMKKTLTQTLKEYETTLKNQDNRIQELEGGIETLYSCSDELTEKNSELELKLERTLSARDTLNGRVEELTEALENSRKVLSQRETELLDTSDQCRAVLEDQIADLRKKVATLEHELCSSRDEGKILQQQLHEKEGELLSLAKSTSGEKASVLSLTSQLEEARQLAEEKEKEMKKQIAAMEGTHQLESAQLSIRLRELTQELETRREEVEVKTGLLDNVTTSYEHEVETIREQLAGEVQKKDKQIKQTEKKVAKMKALELEVKSLKKSNAALEKEVQEEKKQNTLLQQEMEEQISVLKSKEQELLKQKISCEREVQMVKEDWRREVEGLKQCQEPIYDMPPELPQESTVEVEQCQEPIYDEPPELPEESTIYETIVDESSDPPSVLQSIENTHISRPVEEDVLSDLDRPYLPILERSSQLMEDSFSLYQGEERVEIDATPMAGRKKGAWRKAKKRSIALLQNTEVTSPAPKKSRYGLRRRSKHQRFPKENVPMRTTRVASSLKKILPGSSKIKTEQESTPPSENLTTTATKKKRRIRKSQISAPLELMDTPVRHTRGPLQTSSKLVFERQLRPTRK